MLRKIATKSLLFLSFIIFSISADATTYYVSNSGNDANSGTDPSTPWQTLNKVNAFGNFAPGDNILFNRGNTFYGSITISNSGSSGNPITFSAYGSGANPVITGFTNVTSWTNKGGNIWESTNAVSTLSYCNMVVINGVNTGMGRYPNTGYLTYQTITNNTLTSNSLTGNWAGADVVIKKQRWALEIAHITAQSGGTLTFTCPNLDTGTPNFGLFIQNDIRTLDTANEWYYNPSTKKLDIYSISQPTNVQVATIDNLIQTIYGLSYITVSNLSFQGSNATALNFLSSQNIAVTNCSITYAG